MLCALARAVHKRNGDRVKVISAVNILALLVIAALGAWISHDVRTIQKNADHRAAANEIKGFWRDMNNVTQVGAGKAGELGSSFIKYLISAGGALDEYSRLYPLQDKNYLQLDVKYNIAYAEFLSSYGEIMSNIEGVAIEYDYVRLQYHELAIEHNLSGWEKFFNQTDEVRAWKKEVKDDVQDIYNITYSTISESKDPFLAAKKLEILSKKIGKKLKIFSIPYLSGLNEFSDINLKKINNELMK